MTAVNPETLSLFDSDVTVMYKWVSFFKIPVRYLVPQSDVTVGRTVVSIFKLMQEWCSRSLPLLEIYTLVLQQTQNLGAMEISYIYYYVASSTNRAPVELLKEINHFYSALNLAEEESLDMDSRLGSISLLRDVDDLQFEIQEWSLKYQNLLNRDLLTYERIIDVQKQLASIDPVVATEPEIEVVTLEFYPQWKALGYAVGSRSDPNVDNTVDPEDGVEIFNAAIPSYNVPFIQWNDDDGKKYYRVYHGSDENEDRPDFGAVIQHTTQASKKNTLYLKIWVGKANSTPTRESYERCTYYIDEGRLVVQCPVSIDTYNDGEAIIKRRIDSCLGNLDLGPSKEVKVKGHFLVEDVTIDDASFHYLILNDQYFNRADPNAQPLFSTYLYIEESVKSRADKKRLNIHYKSFTGSSETEASNPTDQTSNPASVSITFGPPESVLEMENRFSLDVLGSTPPRQSVLGHDAPKASTLRVNVLRAESRPVLIQFMRVFTRLLRVYTLEKDRIISIFRNIIPEPVEPPRSGYVSSRNSTTSSLLSTPNRGPISPQPEYNALGFNSVLDTEELEDLSDEDDDEDEESVGSSSKPKKARSTADTKVNRLRLKAPDIFVKRYARKCQCPLQPIIIKHDEVNDWRAKTFIDAGRERERQVMAFPPPPGTSPTSTALLKDPNYVAQHWIVCPDDQFAYPTVKRNTDLSNASKYPFIPCCAKTDMLSNTNSHYYTFYQIQNHPGQVPPPRTTSKASYKMRTMKILPWGRRGDIPQRLVELLQTHTGNKDEEWVRCGVGYSSSNSSFLRCVLMAKNNGYEAKDPNHSRDLEVERERYVIDQRIIIAQSIPAAVYRQEMYDLSDLEIIQKVKGNKSKEDLNSIEESENLDPYTMYRGVEEFYDVNIFVFNPSGPLYPPPGPPSQEVPIGPIMEVPRCKMMHIRVRRVDRPSIIILKHHGAPTDAIKYPQCELIVRRTKISQSSEDNTSLPAYLQGSQHPQGSQHAAVEDPDTDAEISDASDSDDDQPCLAEPTVDTPLPHLLGRVSNRSSTIDAASQAGSQFTYRFGPEMTKLLYETLESTSNPYVWSFPKQPENSSYLNITIAGPSLQTRMNPYSKVNWKEVLASSTILTQRIDGYGKTQALTIRVSGGEILTLFIPPTQPIHIPLQSHTKAPNPEEVHRPLESVVRKYLGEPRGRHSYGLWYQAIDFEWAIFIPAVMEGPVEEGQVPTPPIHYSGGVDVVRGNARHPRKTMDEPRPVIVNLRSGHQVGSGRDLGLVTLSRTTSNPTVNPIEELQQVRRWAGVLKAIIIWTWRWGGSSSPRDWWSQYVIRDTTLGDMPQKPILIARRLPIPHNSSRDLSGECIRLMSDWWPAYFRGVEAKREPLGDASERLSTDFSRLAVSGGTPPVNSRVGSGTPGSKIHLNPELFDAMLKYLTHHHKITEGLAIQPETRLRDLYTYDTDFTPQPRSLVLITVEHLQAWLTHIQRRLGSTTPILTKLNLDYAHVSEPFIYRDINTEKMYLIQNVRYGQLSRALHLALQYHYRGYNTGYLTPPYHSPEIIPYLIYGISTSQTLLTIESHLPGSSEYLQVIRYKEEYYAAMLPLL